MTSDLRRRIAAVIAGTAAADVDELAATEPEALIAAARAEGVTALLAGKLLHAAPPSSGLVAAFLKRARDLAKTELRQHAALAAILARLNAAGIPVLVLKGTALRRWLYPEPYLRESSDIDLLLPTRQQAMAAAAALQPFGYAMPYPPGRFANEVMCRHAGTRVELDLHWCLSRNPALGLLPGFQALRKAARPLTNLGYGAVGLGHADALLHACVHRASNLEAGLGDRLKWLFDVHLMATGLDQDGWDVFVAACVRARVCGIARDALEASANLFGTAVSGPAMDALQGAIPHDALDARRLQDWGYLQRQSLRALGWTNGIAWLWGSAFPSFAYMRELYGRDLSRAGLLWVRLRRLLGRLR